jgi:hypothetical protein
VLLLEARDSGGQVAAGDRRGPQAAVASESENTTFGISFIGRAKGPGALGQNPAPRA